MKRPLLICFIAFLALSGCSKKESEGLIKPTITVERDVYEYLNTDETGSIPVQSNVDWAVNVLEGENWLTLAKGDGSVQITMAKNNAISQRVGKIKIVSTDEKASKIVVIKQHGNTPTLIVDKQTFAVESEGEELSVAVSSNMSWEVTSNVEWCTIEREGDEVKITVDENKGLAQRVGIISVKGELPVADKNITITQKGSVNLEVDKRTLTLNRIGDAQVVTVTTNLEWDFSTDNDWITVTKTADDKLEIKANTNNFLERGGSVVVSTEKLNITIQVRQSGFAYGLDLDRQVLIAFYNKLGGDSWNSEVKWKIADPLNSTTVSTSWGGITLENVNGVPRVTKIDLVGKNLRGELPVEIGLLTELKELKVGNNNNISGVLPTTMGNLIKLQVLLMSRNQITGSIPAEFANLKSLHTFQIHTNKLSGTLPVGVIGQMTALNSFEIKANNLTGEIPADMKSHPKWGATNNWNAQNNICPQNSGFGFSNCP